MAKDRSPAFDIDETNPAVRTVAYDDQGHPLPSFNQAQSQLLQAILEEIQGLREDFATAFS